MSRLSRPELSFTIPLYNERDNVAELHRRLTATAKKLAQPYEIVIIDDGSTDDTPTKLRALQKRDRQIKILTLSRNFGHEAAVTAGLDHVTGQVVVLMDGDLQDEPEFVPKLVTKLKMGYDVVFAQHPKRHDGVVRKVGIKIFYQLLGRMASYKLPLDAGTFSVMRREVVLTLRSMPEQNRYIAGLRSWVGFRQVGIDYERPGRAAGVPPQTLPKLVRMGLDALFSFSYIPLKIATFAGLVVSMGAVLGIADVLYQKFFSHTAILGWSGPMLAILVIGGVQLIMLGIIGEYISRIYDEVKRRPYYIISQKTGFLH